MINTKQDINKKRLIFRATHRGTKEADAIIGGFVTTQIGKLSKAQQDALECLLDKSDADLMDWLRGYQPLPTDSTSELLLLIRDYQKSLLSD